MRKYLTLIFMLACGARDLPTATPAPKHVQTTPLMNPSGNWEVRWDRAFANWQPTIFDGVMTLSRDKDGWHGTLTFTQSVTRFAFRSVDAFADHVEIAFEGDGQPAEIVATMHEGRMVGEMRWARIGWTTFSARTFTFHDLRDARVDHAMPSATLHDANPAALDDLLQRARLEHTTALVIIQDGKIVLEKYRDDDDPMRPIMAMSASKSIASLAIGLLIADGKLQETTTMGALFPEWKALGTKANITVRQLLTHTSGLDPSRADFKSNETIRAHALAAKLVYAPGTRFQYDNGAVDFLAVVAGRVAGMPFDEFVQKRIFAPLDITTATWMKDSEGTARAAGELSIRPVDLAKIGQMMLDGGKWNGVQVVSPDWVKRSIEPGQSFDSACGLLWWREGDFAHAITEAVLAGWSDAKVDATTIKAARALIDRNFDSTKDLIAEIERTIGGAATSRLRAAVNSGDHVPMDARVDVGRLRGFSARGWLGQFLVVLPQKHIVGVRMRRAEERDSQEPNERNAYGAFGEDLAKVF